MTTEEVGLRNADIESTLQAKKYASH